MSDDERKRIEALFVEYEAHMWRLPVKPPPGDEAAGILEVFSFSGSLRDLTLEDMREAIDLFEAEAMCGATHKGRKAITSEESPHLCIFHPQEQLPPPPLRPGFQPVRWASVESGLSAVAAARGVGAPALVLAVDDPNGDDVA